MGTIIGYFIVIEKTIRADIQVQCILIMKTNIFTNMVKVKLSL
jgi:hypothetical protein